ncbi:MAG TPA: tetratricopeptide repeat protein [Thermoleophilaceae bacterium]|nr:tetratricopeptide repeat protein [Thermoleophilaceae bacterium]
MSRSSAVAARALPLIFGVALAGVAFGAEGGTELTRTTVTEMLLVVVSGGLVAAAFVWGRRGAIQGVTTILLFSLLAVLTAASVLWSIAPELTYIEAGRTFAYLCVFAAAVAVTRLAPHAAPHLLEGLTIGAVIPIAYSLASRIWPSALAENEVSNRLGQPFDYWNAVGCVAAMLVPLALWLGTRRGGSPTARVSAYPILGAAILAILLTQSRGAAAAAAVAAIAWFALVPLRLRALPVLVAPLIAASAVGAWALSKDPFTKSLQPLSAKESVAAEFGGLVFLMLAVLLLVGALVEAGSARRGVSGRTRRRVGIAAVAVACIVPLAGLTSVALSDRGIGDRIDELTSETEVSPEEGGGRVFAASSSRGKYWREAFHVFDDRPLEGVGAGAFAIGRLRHRTDASVTRHAHGWIPQTMADLGLLGLGVTTLLMLVWIVAALSATGLVPRRLMRAAGSDAPLPRRDWDRSRIALVTLAIVPLAFAVQSLLDWTWFIPAPAVMALVAAGFVAGRGPFGADDLHGRTQRISWRPTNPRLPAAFATIAAALLLVWAIWQPEASDRATNEALALTDEGKFERAIAKTEDARDINPLTPDPLLVRAAAETKAGREDDARESLEKAVLSFPGDPQTWYRLAAFQLGTLDAPEQALETLDAVLYLDPHSRQAGELFLGARARLREQTGRAMPELDE